MLFRSTGPQQPSQNQTRTRPINRSNIRAIIDFQVCDGTATGFDDGEFTFLVCQQGLQYFPDEDAALAELRRVAAGGARFVFTVWSRPSPLIVALANSLRVHAGADLAKQSLAPFAWAGAETIVDRMSAAHYIHINLEELEVNRVLDDPEQSIPKEIMSTPVGPSVTAMGKAVFDKVVAEMLDATRRYRHDDQLVIPQHTHLITVVAADIGQLHRASGGCSWRGCRSLSAVPQG